MTEPGGDSTAIAADPAAEPLRLYLANRDVPCPHCQYNLRGVSAPACPECGKPLVLSVQRDRAMAPAFFAGLLFAWLIGLSLLTGIPIARLIIQRARYESHGAGLRREWGAIDTPPQWHWPILPAITWVGFAWAILCCLIGVFGTLSLLRTGNRPMERRWLCLRWLAAAAFGFYICLRVYRLVEDW